MDAKWTPTSGKSLLSEYLKHLGRRLSWPDFPVTLHQHPRNPDFATVGMSKWNLLYHHVGSAVRAYQEREQFGHEVNLTPAKLGMIQGAEETLERRVNALECLVAVPLKDWKIVGNEATGFHLEI